MTNPIRIIGHALRELRRNACSESCTLLRIKSFNGTAADASHRIAPLAHAFLYSLVHQRRNCVSPQEKRPAMMASSAHKYLRRANVFHHVRDSRFLEYRPRVIEQPDTHFGVGRIRMEVLHTEYREFVAWRRRTAEIEAAQVRSSQFQDVLFEERAARGNCSGTDDIDANAIPSVSGENGTPAPQSRTKINHFHGARI